MPTEPVRILSPSLVLQRGRATRLLRRFAGSYALVAAAIGCLVTARPLPGDLGLIVTVLPLALAALAALASAVAVRRSRVRMAGELVVADGALRLPAGAPIAAAQIATAFTVPGNGVRYTRVELRLRNGDRASIDLARPEDGEPLLAAAGVAARDRRLSFRVGTGVELAWRVAAASVLGTFLGSFVMIFVIAATNSTRGATMLLAWLGTMLATVAVALAHKGPGRIEVGRDGVLVRRGLRRRFVPFTRIAEVHHARAHDGQPPSDVYVRLDDARIVPLNALSLSADERIGLATRIGTERIAAAVGHERLELLDRAGRPLDAWRVALRDLAGRTQGYRAVAIAREDLVRVLDDPGTVAERRIGAAIALAGSGDPEARARVRVAASACAEPSLRTALERAAADALDADAVERAVASAERVTRT